MDDHLPWPPTCLFRSTHLPSPVELLWRRSHLPWGGSYVSPLSCVSLVSIFGLFPVLVMCDNELIIVQLCLSHYLCPDRWSWSLSCVLKVLSVQLDFLWSIRYSLVFLSVSTLPCLVLSCPALFGVIKDCLFELHPRLHVPRSSLLCTPWHIHDRFFLLLYTVSWKAPYKYTWRKKYMFWQF